MTMQGKAQVFQSALKSAAFMTPPEIERLEQGALQGALGEAGKDPRMSGELHSRALMPSDLGETNEIWGWQTGSSGNVWENSLIDNQALNDNVVVAIYGLVDTSHGHYVAGIRINAGSARRYQMSTYDYFTDDMRIEARTAYMQVPIIITKEQSVTISYYILGAGGRNQSLQIAWKGWVLEKPGVTLTA